MRELCCDKFSILPEFKKVLSTCYVCSAALKQQHVLLMPKKCVTAGHVQTVPTPGAAVCKGLQSFRNAYAHDKEEALNPSIYEKKHVTSCNLERR
jgi:hypothetical protein